MNSSDAADSATTAFPLDNDEDANDEPGNSFFFEGMENYHIRKKYFSNELHSESEEIENRYVNNYVNMCDKCAELLKSPSNDITSWGVIRRKKKAMKK